MIATGLAMKFAGGMAISVDGVGIVPSDVYMYENVFYFYYPLNQNVYVLSFLQMFSGIAGAC